MKATLGALMLFLESTSLKLYVGWMIGTIVHNGSLYPRGRCLGTLNNTKCDEIVFLMCQNWYVPKWKVRPGQ